MTIQQLRYIIALDKYRHFAQAAEECGISQPTLSTMVQKLEEELDVVLFDRTRQPIVPTATGRLVIEQARSTLREMEKIGELVKNESQRLSGPLTIGILPTISPCLTPSFIKLFTTAYPGIELSITEMRPRVALQQLRGNHIDVAILTTPRHRESDLLIIPLYNERFVAYFADDAPCKDPQAILDGSLHDKLWILQESHCEQQPIFGFCKNSNSYNHVYEAGSIDTLIRIVDANGGCTVIPEWHVSLLDENRRANIRTFDNTAAQREVALIIRNDFVREAHLNAIAHTARSIIPREMIHSYLLHDKIRL